MPSIKRDPKDRNAAPWTAEEDADLLSLDAKYCHAWRLIATKLGGGGIRTDSQCSNRWGAIDPSISKGRFSAEEDSSLLKLVEEHGPTWAVIASKLVVAGKRSDQQCKHRWKTIDPSLHKARWTLEEDRNLTSLVLEHGTSWSLISTLLDAGRRSNKQCSNRWALVGNVSRKESSSHKKKSSTKKKKAQDDNHNDNHNDKDSDADDDNVSSQDMVTDFSRAMASAAPQHQYGGNSSGKKPSSKQGKKSPPLGDKSPLRRKKGGFVKT
jgi:hypothetical protein